MREGWLNDDYIILFEPSEIERFTRAYEIDRANSRWRLVGLLNWNDFILTDDVGVAFAIPTVPIDEKYREPCDLPSSEVLRADRAMAGKIRWHATPLIFGGDPRSDDNVSWVTLDEHVQLVVWWNNLYRDVAPAQENR